MGFQRDVVTTIGSRILILGIGVVQSVIIARYLQPVGRGQYAVLFLIPQFVMMVIPLGLQWSLVFHIREGKYPVDRLLQNGLGAGLTLGFLGLIVTLTSQLAFRDSFLSGLPALALALASITLPGRVLLACAQGVFRGWNRIVYANLAATVQSILLFLSVLLALAMLRLGVLGLTAATLAAETTTVVLMGLVIFRGLPLRPRLEKTVTGPLLEYGSRVYAFTILLFLNYRADMALIRYLVDYREVGYYVTAVGLAEILWNVPQSLGFVLFPNIVGVSPEERSRKSMAVCRVTVAAMTMVCVLTAAAAYPLILILYGKSFLPAVRPLVAILPGILAMSVQQVLGADLAARNRPGSVTWAAGVGVIVNLLLNLWWIPRGGAVGAALASTVSYTVVAGMALRSFLKFSGQGLFDTLVIKAEDVWQAVSRIRRFPGPVA